MSNSPSPSLTLDDHTEFHFLSANLDLLLQQPSAYTANEPTISSSTCEVINIQPLDQLQFQLSTKKTKRNQTARHEMRSRQHLQYETIKTFRDSNEFDEWWTHSGGSAGWIFNTIYKKKTEDEVHVYRCAYKCCSLRLRVVFVANSCDVRVERAIIQHMHDERQYSRDSIKTLSSDVKNKIATLEGMGLTATKIRRSLFKESTEGDVLPTLKQVQNYIARLRTKRVEPVNGDEHTEKRLITSSTPQPTNSGRKRGRPRLSDLAHRSTDSNIETAKSKAAIDLREKITVLSAAFNQTDDTLLNPSSNDNNDDDFAESEAFRKLSQLIESCQPTMKRTRLSYHFERSFSNGNEFREWWSGSRSEGMVHNSTYANNAGEQIDIYRCSKRDCHHRVRVVSNPNDGTVCVERTDADHDLAVHNSKTTLTKRARSVIVDLFELGLKPKAIRTHFLQSSAKPSEVPTMTQIKNLVNRLKIKQKAEASVSSARPIDLL